MYRTFYHTMILKARASTVCCSSFSQVWLFHLVGTDCRILGSDQRSFNCKQSVSLDAIGAPVPVVSKQQKPLPNLRKGFLDMLVTLIPKPGKKCNHDFLCRIHCCIAGVRRCPTMTAPLRRPSQRKDSYRNVRNRNHLR